MALIMSEFVIKFMLISIYKLSTWSSISRSLSKAVSFTIIVSGMSILKTVVMALIMGEFMIKFMLIAIDKLSFSRRFGISRSLSKSISFSVIVSGVSILEAIIMALIMCKLMIKFMLIAIDKLSFSRRFGISRSLSKAI